MGDRIKIVAILIAVLAVAFGVFWLAKLFGGGENVQSEKPLVICQPQNVSLDKQKCFWTAHIHAHVQVFKGDQEVPLGFEQGDLEKSHSHSEKNKIHWHGLILVDPNTKELKNRSSLKLENLLRDLKISIDGNPKFIVNSKEVDPSYIWEDGDHIEVHYK